MEATSASSPPRGRELLADLYEAAVAAVAPAPLISAALSDLDARHEHRFWLFGFGKPAPGMAAGAVSALRRSLFDIAGGVVVSAELVAPVFSTVRAAVGDHPMPGARSFAAAQLVGETVGAMRGDDAAVVLIGGGTTSLIGHPVRGVTEADLELLFVQLIDAGLDIGAMNAVRKRFLRWGAGRLALALAPARTHVLLMSDVPADAPADVGSGPCTPDEWTASDITTLLREADLLGRLAPSLRDYLSAVARGTSPETPKPGHPAFAHVSTRVVATNALAIDAVLARARALGVPARRAASPLTGDAARCGEQIAGVLLECMACGEAGCMVWGGETVVRLDDSRDGVTSTTHASVAHASGGRCQELALAAARVLSGAGQAGERVTLLAAGTDGRDGPTDAAGAFADGALWQRMRDAGADPDVALARHRSYHALDAAGALFRRGPTGTNVMDVVIAVIE